MGRLLLLLIILLTAQRESIQLKNRPSEEEKGSREVLTWLSSSLLKGNGDVCPSC